MDELETVRSAIALALASIDFCISATDLVSASMEALRSAASPMLPEQDATDDEVVGDEVVAAAAGGEAEPRGGVDRLERDTTLSRARER